MSNELESDSVMVMNLESFGVDGAGYDETETEPPSSTNLSPETVTPAGLGHLGYSSSE